MSNDLLADVESLGALPDELRDEPLAPVSAGALGDAIDELAAGPTTTFVNGSRDYRREIGIDRIGVVTHDSGTVRLLMLTASWKWRGPYTRDDPEASLRARGYEPAPSLQDDTDDEARDTDTNSDSDADS